MAQLTTADLEQHAALILACALNKAHEHLAAARRRQGQEEAGAYSYAIDVLEREATEGAYTLAKVCDAFGDTDAERRIHASIPEFWQDLRPIQREARLCTLPADSADRVRELMKSGVPA